MTTVIKIKSIKQLEQDLKAAKEQGRVISKK